MKFGAFEDSVIYVTTFARQLKNASNCRVVIGKHTIHDDGSISIEPETEVN